MKSIKNISSQAFLHREVDNMDKNLSQEIQHIYDLLIYFRRNMLYVENESKSLTVTKFRNLSLPRTSYQAYL